MAGHGLALLGHVAHGCWEEVLGAGWGPRPRGPAEPGEACAGGSRHSGEQGLSPEASQHRCVDTLVSTVRMCMHASVQACVHVCSCVCMHVSGLVYMCAHICAYVHECAHVCCVCMHVCICLCGLVYM